MKGLFPGKRRFQGKRGYQDKAFKDKPGFQIKAKRGSQIRVKANQPLKHQKTSQVKRKKDRHSKKGNRAKPGFQASGFRRAKSVQGKRRIGDQKGHPLIQPGASAFLPLQRTKATRTRRPGQKTSTSNRLFKSAKFLRSKDWKIVKIKFYKLL